MKRYSEGKLIQHKSPDPVMREREKDSPCLMRSSRTWAWPYSAVTPRGVTPCWSVSDTPPPFCSSTSMTWAWPTLDASCTAVHFFRQTWSTRAPLKISADAVGEDPALTAAGPEEMMGGLIMILQSGFLTYHFNLFWTMKFHTVGQQKGLLKTRKTKRQMRQAERWTRRTVKFDMSESDGTKLMKLIISQICIRLGLGSKFHIPGWRTAVHTLHVQKNGAFYGYGKFWFSLSIMMKHYCDNIDLIQAQTRHLMIWENYVWTRTSRENETCFLKMTE